MNGSVVALAREHGRTEPDKAALDFIEGRITRGEFNRKRRDILEQTDQQVQLVARELIASAACFSTHHRLAFDGVLLFFDFNALCFQCRSNGRRRLGHSGAGYFSIGLDAFYRVDCDDCFLGKVASIPCEIAARCSNLASCNHRRRLTPRIARARFVPCRGNRRRNLPALIDTRTAASDLAAGLESRICHVLMVLSREAERINNKKHGCGRGWTC